MAVDIEYAINLMQAVNRAISGVSRAPDLSAYPTALNTADLPYVITWPGPGSWYNKGGGWRVDERQMMVIGYVEPINQGDIPQRAVEAVQLFQAVRAAYISNTNIPLAFPTPGQSYQITVESSNDKRHTDGGLVSNLSFGGVLYHGFVLNVNIRILWS